jgi:cardiolipin synthase
VVKLLVQPEDGASPLLDAIDGARATIDLYVFRLDHRQVGVALERAARRGVAVRALVTHSRRGGELGLRQLARRLRRKGIAVSRSDDDLLRYHGKMAIVDGRTLFVLGYNFTRLDIEHSRSLGLMVDESRLVEEARRMFEADFARRAYVPEHGALVVSPYNSRAVLARLIQQAKKQLLIYDKRLSDGVMLRLIEKQAQAGVEVRIIGKTDRPLKNVPVAKFPGRLHVRAIIQDGWRLFVGSQSLRRAELDKRREVGAVVSAPAVLKSALAVFGQDWAACQSGAKRAARKAIAPTDRTTDVEHRSGDRRAHERR